MEISKSTDGAKIGSFVWSGARLNGPSGLKWVTNLIRKLRKIQGNIKIKETVCRLIIIENRKITKTNTGAAYTVGDPFHAITHGKFL